jgi:hypothetical protein
MTSSPGACGSCGRSCHPALCVAGVIRSPHDVEASFAPLDELSPRRGRASGVGQLRRLVDTGRMGCAVMSGRRHIVFDRSPALRAGPTARPVCGRPTPGSWARRCSGPRGPARPWLPYSGTASGTQCRIGAQRRCHVLTKTSRTRRASSTQSQPPCSKRTSPLPTRADDDVQAIAVTAELVLEVHSSAPAGLSPEPVRSSSSRGAG